METVEAIEKDLHPPYQVLIIFMLMLIMSAYSQQKSNESVDTARTEHHTQLKSHAEALLTENSDEEMQHSTQLSNDSFYYSTVASENLMTPTLDRGDTPQFAD